MEWEILEKKGHSYRVSPYAQELARSTALMFKGLLTGRVFADSQSSLKAILSLARECAELKYARGRIDERERSECVQLIEKFEKQME